METHRKSQFSFVIWEKGFKESERLFYLWLCCIFSHAIFWCSLLLDIWTLTTLNLHVISPCVLRSDGKYSRSTGSVSSEKFRYTVIDCVHRKELTKAVFGSCIENSLCSYWSSMYKAAQTFQGTSAYWSRYLEW